MARGTGATQLEARSNKVHEAARMVARVVGVAAALGTVATTAHEMGLDGTQTRRTIGSLGATWVGLAPAVDTMTSLGDTIHLAATVTDKRGTALIGTSIKWSVDHPDVAIINSDGTVIAQAPGMATVVVTLGDLVARSTIVVHPTAAAVHVAADSALTVAEQSTHVLSATATDARGHVVTTRSAHWKSSDTSVTMVDSVGTLIGVNAGHATVTATLDGASSDAPVTVIPIPGALALVSGAGQDAPAGATLPTPIIVRVLSRHGRAMPAATVHFRRADATSTAEVATLTADADGRVRCTWKLGDLAGRQRLVASTDGVDSVLTVEADAEPVNANTRLVPLADTQSTRIATALTTPVGVRITDTTGRVMPDVEVHWVTLDAGTVTSKNARTDSLGEARAVWVLGPHAGAQRVRVLIGNGRTVRPLTLHATALPGPPSAISLVTGDAQHAGPGAALAKGIAVRVQDAAGNPVRGIRVTFTPAHGTVSDTATYTDSVGIAHQHWTLGTATGPQHLTARVDGVLKPITIMATAATPAASHSKASRSSHHHA